MVLTQDVAGGGDGPPLKVSETIVRNLRVLATDQRIDSKDEEGKTEVKTFANVTLEATPRIAEKIAVAQSHGHAVAVAALDRRQYGRARAGGRRRRRQGAGRHQPGRRAPMLLAIANRPIDSNTTFTPAATCRASSAAASRRAPSQPAPATP